jgi:hypothetical protein
MNGGPSGNLALRSGGAGTFNGGNNMTYSRMGRMDHDHDHDRDGRFRGRHFAFGFGFPDYYNYYDDDDYLACYRWTEVHTRYGWRWRRIWVCD